MAEVSLGTDLLVIIFSSFVLGYITLKAKEPIIIGYLLAGVILGGSVLNVIQNTEIIEVLAEIGVALLLFNIGIEFSFHDFKKNRKLFVGAPVLQMLLSGGLLFAIFQLLRGPLGLDFYSSLFMASVFALSSTAAVIKLLSDQKIMNESSSKLMTTWLIIQDLAVIPISIILLRIGEGGGSPLGAISISLLKAALILIVSLFLLRKVVQWLFENIAQQNSRELLLIASLALSLGMAFLTQMLGISFVLGAFLAGLMLSGTSFYTKIYTEIRSIKDIFTLLFFFSIGALLNIQAVWENLLVILIVVVVAIVVKLLTIFISTKVFKGHSRSAIKASLGLFQVGEFSFVLGKIALDNGYLDERVYLIILSAAIITLIITPLVMFRGAVLYEFMRETTRKNARFFYKTIFFDEVETNDDIPGIKDHVVICGYGRVGHSVGLALKESDVDFVVIDENEETVQDALRNKVTAIFGDTADVEILEKADVESAKTIVVAVPSLVESIATVQAARSLNPDIHVVARSHDKETRERLQEMNVDLIIEPEFETAKKIVTEVLPIVGKGFKRRVDSMEVEHEKNVNN